MILDGELDLATGPPLAALLTASTAPAEIGAGLVVDLAQVEFCDSAGLIALATARHQLRSRGRDLVLRNPSPTVAAMVELLYRDSGLLEQPHDRKECRLTC